MMKKLLASLLSLVMLFSVAGCSEDKKDDAKDEEVKDNAEKMVEETIKVEPMSGTCGDNLAFELTEDGTLTISGTGEMYHYNYSDNDEKLPPWADQRKGIKKIVVEYGVAGIGERAFYDSAVETVIFPSSISCIEYEAFKNCKKLENLVFPEEMDGQFYILTSVFENCVSLKDVTLPEPGEVVKNAFGYDYCVGFYSFRDCTNLTYMQLPKSSIKMMMHLGAFENCTSLKAVRLPDAEGEIHNEMFSDCTDLTIYGEEGSYAQTYAEENGIAFVAE